MNGILWAFVPLIGWGVGDFLIQKSVRQIGIYQTLAVTGLMGGVLFLPWVWGDIGNYSIANYLMLLLTSGITFAGALILFEALRVGKISVVESVVSIELPISVLLSVFVGGESLPWWQWILFIIISSGILLAVTTQFDHLKSTKKILEKGTLLALAAAVFSALNNFNIGFASQAFSPLFVVWFVHLMIGIASVVSILVQGKGRETLHLVRTHAPLLFTQSFLDNIAWYGYGMAASLSTVSFAVIISESYIVLAVLLGLVFGKEKLKPHQIFGSIIAFVAVIALSFLRQGLEG